MKEKSEMQAFCDSAERLKQYLQQKAWNHNSYKCYSKMDYIAPIVQEKVLYLNDGKHWNDIPDRENLASEGGDCVNFGKCFSFSQDENVAMWMLYGGIRHNGAMVDFTRLGMQNICKCEKITLGYFENEMFQPLRDVSTPEFRIWLTDIVYCDDKTGYLKRSEEGCPKVTAEVINQLGVCKKAYPWHYENECRLIVTVKKDLIPDKCNTVKIDLSQIELGKSLSRAYYCPGYRGERKAGFVDSKLQGKIDWDLCDAACEKMR